MECYIHKIPMDWEPDILVWLDRFGCLLDPCKMISMMSNGPKGRAAH